jgi:hypothetical protein
MIGVLIQLIIYLVIVGVIYWAVTTILGVIPLPDPIKRVIQVLCLVVLVLIIVFALLQLIPEVGGIHLRGFG